MTRLANAFLTRPLEGCRRSRIGNCGTNPAIPASTTLFALFT